MAALGMIPNNFYVSESILSIPAWIALVTLSGPNIVNLFKNY
jgi:hypothetical protein